MFFSRWNPVLLTTKTVEKQCSCLANSVHYILIFKFHLPETFVKMSNYVHTHFLSRNKNTHFSAVEAVTILLWKVLFDNSKAENENISRTRTSPPKKLALRCHASCFKKANDWPRSTQYLLPRPCLQVMAQFQNGFHTCRLCWCSPFTED